MIKSRQYSYIKLTKLVEMRLTVSLRFNVFIPIHGRRIDSTKPMWEAK